MYDPVGIWPTRDYHAFSASSSNQSRAPRIRPRVTPTPTKDLVIAVMYHVQNKDTYVSSRRFWLDRLQSDIRIPCETKNSLASFVVYSYTGIAHIARMYSNMHFVSGEGPLEIATNAFQECFHLYTNASFFIRLESRAFLFPENLAQELCRQNPSKNLLFGFLKNSGRLVYPALEAGYVISRQAVSSCRLSSCANYTREDVGIALCLAQNCNLQSTRMFGLNPDTPEKMLQWAASPPPDFNFPSFPLDKDNVWQIPAPITYHHITHEWMQVMSNRLTGAEQGVPKIIHQIWFDRDSGQGRPRVLMNSCKVRNPGWDHRILNLCNTKDLSQDRQSPHQTGFVLEDSLKLRGWPTSLLNLLSSDIIRIELLYRYGGVYIDADVLCLKSLDYLIPMIEGELSFAWEKSDWSLVANGIMIGFQYSWALLRVLEHYLKLQFFVHGGQLPNPWMDTGPLFFWKKIVQPAFCLPVQCIHQDFASQSSAFMKTPPPRLQDEISWSGDAHNQYCWSDISTTVLAARVFYPYQHAQWADGLHKKEVRCCHM